eukprot:TRINITY_DN2219_c0_g1_i1.p1 TRINITY_DN2219_c0_g1~~TRINITY_DN2219_c0_g1_i1.p1  ORF type:complete len:571 (+),score=168.20 TRINITY_DN2219_c0_g1_i1:91-1803(+)
MPDGDDQKPAADDGWGPPSGAWGDSAADTSAAGGGDQEAAGEESEGPKYGAANADPNYVHQVDVEETRRRIPKEFRVPASSSKLEVRPERFASKRIAEFSELKLHPDLAKGLEKLYKVPTPIQAVSVPCGLLGLDILTAAQTGSGKTLCFNLVMGQRLMQKGDFQAAKVQLGVYQPTALVVSPTRELAMQICEHALVLFEFTELRVGTAYGGVKQRLQYDELKKQCCRRQLLPGCDVLVGCPGRLADLSSTGDDRRPGRFGPSMTCELGRCEFLVLDEADRLLDMGFQDEMDQIVSRCASDRQTLLYSATLDPRELDLADGYLRRSERVLVRLGINKSIPQSMNFQFHEAEEGWGNEGGADTPFELMSRVTAGKKALVFVPTKAEARDWSRQTKGARAIHGDMSQEDREYSLECFRDGRCRILIATDVAQRGLDIPEVTDVFNVHLPQNEDDFLHRSGRCARRGTDGTVHIMIVKGRSCGSLPAIVGVLKENKREVPRWVELLARQTTADCLYRSRSRSRGPRGGGYGGGGARQGSRGPPPRPSSRGPPPRQGSRGPPPRSGSRGPAARW